MCNKRINGRIRNTIANPHSWKQVLEVYYNKMGFRPGDQVVLHSRRRCRLVAMHGAAPNPPPDPSLWIVHYGPADKVDQIPTSAIQVTPQLQQMLQVRRQLLQMGQIARKEFMLSDRVNWPQIPFPGRGNPMYAPPANVRNLPPTMAYPPASHPGAAPNSKRRGGFPAPAQGPVAPPSIQPPELAFDDDEDTTRGDMFDHITPRDVSMGRYQTNYDMMREVLVSPYPIGRIAVADLGLGLKGQLAPLTDGIFEAQGAGAAGQSAQNPYTGHLDPKLAEEFRKRVTEHIDTARVEMDKMKLDHDKFMGRSRRNAKLTQAVDELRTIREPGSEVWRLEGEHPDSGEDGVSSGSPKQDRSVDDVVRDVDEALGKHARVVSMVHRVQAGGYLDSIPEPAIQTHNGAGGGVAPTSTNMSRHASQAGSQHSGLIVGDAEMDGGGTAAGLLDQMHSGFSSASTPVNFPTPQPQLSAMQSNAGTPVNMGVPSPHPDPAGQAAANTDTGAADVDMEDAGTTRQGSNTVDPTANSNAGTATSSAVPQQPAAPTSKPASAAPTPGFDHNDFSSLGDLDTAGEALAGYDPPSIDATGGQLGDDGLDLGMDVEDSAFGEAFHDPNSAVNTPGEGAN